jgi:hypothetical protein
VARIIQFESHRPCHGHRGWPSIERQRSKDIDDDEVGYIPDGTISHGDIGNSAAIEAAKTFVGNRDGTTGLRESPL